VKTAAFVLCVTLFLSIAGCAGIPSKSSQVSSSDSDNEEYCVLPSRCKWCKRVCKEDNTSTKTGTQEATQADPCGERHSTFTVDDLTFCSQRCVDRYLAAKKDKSKGR
jgi:hypothetical protein